MPAKENIFAFFGSDEALVKEAATKLAEKIAPKNNEFGLEIVSGGADNSDHASQIVSRTIEAIQTMPFFGGEKVVWLQGANFFADNQTGKAETTLSALETLIGILSSHLPSDVKVIISAGEVDKRRSFFKSLSKCAKVAVFDKLDTTKSGWEGNVMGHVQNRAKSLQLTFERGALEHFVLLVGADTRVIDSELEKLSLYTAGRAVSTGDVSAIASVSHTGVIFAIGDAISRRELPKALNLIDQQLRRGESAIGILLASIVPKVRALLHARDLIERRGIRVGRYDHFQKELEALPPSETAHIGRTKEGAISAYPLFLAAQISGKFSTSELKRALEACLEANLRLVTTSLDHRLVLHQLVTRILTRPN
ncbi:MAG: DNA polymerase III subunit delta [Verrucomicrobiales bacterium]|jgi:DNA polymerase-3 subunit delta|nr:DNA polymerase III subunit delta [Verrucomicrobiales bacterium]MBP9223294.1 DNA polymerase III subunit delta [Verrucomicrobiales bacterium]